MEGSLVCMMEEVAVAGIVVVLVVVGVRVTVVSEEAESVRAGSSPSAKILT